MDFDVSADVLERHAEEAFGVGFAKWKLDIPEVGVVLMMGSIGSINGTKIQLGLGTNLRDPKLHRSEIMREL